MSAYSCALSLLYDTFPKFILPLGKINICISILHVLTLSLHLSNSRPNTTIMYYSPVPCCRGWKLIRARERQKKISRNGMKKWLRFDCCFLFIDELFLVYKTSENLKTVQEPTIKLKSNMARKWKTNVQMSDVRTPANCGTKVLILTEKAKVFQKNKCTVRHTLSCKGLL